MLNVHKDQENGNGDESSFEYPAYRDWRNVGYVPSVGLVPIDPDVVIRKSTSIGTFYPNLVCIKGREVNFS